MPVLAAVADPPPAPAVRVVEATLADPATGEQTVVTGTYLVQQA